MRFQELKSIYSKKLLDHNGLFWITSGQHSTSLSKLMQYIFFPSKKTTKQLKTHRLILWFLFLATYHCYLN